jgi:hypothetical protein
MRSPEIEIRNTSAVSLEALAVSMVPVDRDGAQTKPFVVFVDASVDQTAQPVGPSEKYTIPVPDRLVAGGWLEDLYKPPITTAAIFSDGSTSGDAALIGRLIARRCNMLQAVETALGMLSNAGKHNVPRGQLIDRFQVMADSLNHWYLPPEQQVGRGLYQSVIAKLMNLPDLPLGAPFPPTPFVEQETALLNRARTALLESKAGLGPSEPETAAVRR